VWGGGEVRGCVIVSVFVKCVYESLSCVCAYVYIYPQFIHTHTLSLSLSLMFSVSHPALAPCS
jgi:hypothetical protein